MNELTIFKNEQFGEVRSITKDGQPWFVAADVCKALEIGNPSQAISRLDEDEHFTTLISNESAASGKSNASFVNEAGLYTLVLGSRKPEAKAFKRWITHEVIPSIRKHGAYMTKETLKNCLSDPDFAIGLLNKLKEDEEKITALEAEKAVLLPKASYCDVILHSPGLLSVTQIAKDYGESAVWLNKILAEEKVQYKHRKEWILYSKYANKGYATSQTGTHPTSEGIDSHLHTYWTQKGRQFIYELLKNKRGIVPIMERETEETV